MQKSSGTVPTRNSIDRTNTIGARMLAASELTEEDILGNMHKLFTLWFRGCNQIPRIYDTAVLLILNNSHPLAELT